MLKILVSVYFILYLYSPHHLHAKKRDDDLQSYTFLYSIDLLNRNNTIENFKNSFNVSLFENMIVYEFNNMFDSTGSSLVLKNTFKEEFFVFEKDSLVGYSYNPRRPSLYERLPVDSILNARAFKNVRWDSVTLLKPVEVVLDTLRGELKETYWAKPKNSLVNDSAYFFYSKELNDINYSMSKILDSTKGMKLYEVRMIYNPSYFDQVKAITPRREIFFRLQRNTNPDRKKILYYIEKYKNDIEGR